MRLPAESITRIGGEPMVECPDCDGTGDDLDDLYNGPPRIYVYSCDYCEGAGLIDANADDLEAERERNCES